MKYYINYHTGRGNETVNGTLAEAMKIADKGAAYTQQSIIIEDEETGETAAMRTWYGHKYDEADEDNYQENPICFGKSGFYADWVIF